MQWERVAKREAKPAIKVDGKGARWFIVVKIGGRGARWCILCGGGE